VGPHFSLRPAFNSSKIEMTLKQENERKGASCQTQNLNPK
jgi:hypothetical protein